MTNGTSSTPSVPQQLQMMVMSSPKGIMDFSIASPLSHGVRQEMLDDESATLASMDLEHSSAMNLTQVAHLVSIIPDPPSRIRLHRRYRDDDVLRSQDDVSSLLPLPKRVLFPLKFWSSFSPWCQWRISNDVTVPILLVYHYYNAWCKTNNSPSDFAALIDFPTLRCFSCFFV